MTVSPKLPKPSDFELEIREQPRVLAHQLAQLRAPVEAVAADICSADPRFAIIAARGSSDNAARYGQYLFGLDFGHPGRGLPVGLATPSLLTRYGSQPRLGGAFVLGISQSGQTPDVVAVVEHARRAGGLTVAMTNAPTSALAAAAERVLELHAGTERAVAASKTYTTSLMALAMLRAAMLGDDGRWSELEAIPEVIAHALALAGDLRAAADRFRAADRVLVVARGLAYATGFELALKLAEAAGVVALPFSAADFQHGPIALADADTPVVVVAPRGPAGDDVAVLVPKLRARGVEIIAISPREDVLAQAAVAIAVPEVPPWLAPIVEIIGGQLWTVALAHARGYDPDHPRGLSKVTRTL